VDLEILPSAEVSVAGGTIAEDSGVANVTVTRSVNIYGGVSVMFAALVGNGSTAADGVHFSSLSTPVTFAPYESTKVVSVPIVSIPGYSAASVTFAVMLSNAENATISVAKAAITINNVHPPAPTAPTFLAKTSTTLRITWNAPVWPTPPMVPDWSTVLEYHVEQSQVQNRSHMVTSWAVSQSQVTNAETQLDVTGLEVYSMYRFRVRVRTERGWSAFSAMSSPNRTEAVCGDGLRHASEECDVGATGDGCDGRTCRVQEGYFCSGGSPTKADTCVAGCGDTKQVKEECDDGNLDASDGCTSCNLDPGWTCSSNNDHAVTSGCATTCGDGIRAGPEVLNTQTARFAS
jgi:cysteine-rich repeat protein